MNICDTCGGSTLNEPFPATGLISCRACRRNAVNDKRNAYAQQAFRAKGRKPVGWKKKGRQNP